MSRQYAVYVSSEANEWNDVRNAYGYWLGKIYTNEGGYFPICIGFVDMADSDLKVYKSQKPAQKAAEKILNSCGYVLRAEVKEVDKIGGKWRLVK